MLTWLLLISHLFIITESNVNYTKISDIIRTPINIQTSALSSTPISPMSMITETTSLEIKSTTTANDAYYNYPDYAFHFCDRCNGNGLCFSVDKIK